MSEIKPTESIEEFSTKNYRDLITTPNHDIVAVKEPEMTEEQKAAYDFEQARQNIKEILNKGATVLDDMISLAKASDHPRAFEVAGNLIKTMVDVNKDLMDLHKKRKDIISGEEQLPTNTQNVQNNTVFVGSSKDLLDVLSK